MVKIYTWQSIALCNWLRNVPGFCALLKSKWPAMPSGHKSHVPLVSIKAHLQGNNHMQLIPVTVILRLLQTNIWPSTCLHQTFGCRFQHPFSYYNTQECRWIGALSRPYKKKKQIMYRNDRHHQYRFVLFGNKTILSLFFVQPLLLASETEWDLLG
jgi:hypothetical protein